MSNFTGRTSFEDQAAAYRQEMENQFGLEFNTNTASNNFRLIYPFLSELVVRFNKLEDWLNQRNIYNAEGINLDNLLGNFNFLRKQPSKAQVNWSTLDSTPTTFVDVGDLQVQDSSNNVFENIISGTVAGDGSLALTMRSLVAGEDQNINAGTLTDIVTPISGIGTGSNSLDAAGGQDQEIDSEYRIRFLTSGTADEAWTLAALQTEISEVDGVTTVKVYENDTTGTVNGIPKKSIYCVVQGGIDADIAQAIYDKTNHAIYRHGTEVVVIADARGENVTIRFDRPLEVDLEYELIVTPTQDVSLIEAEIESYIDGTPINDLLSEYKAIKQIEANLDTSGIETMQIGFREQLVGGAYLSTLQMDIAEKAVNF